MGLPNLPRLGQVATMFVSLSRVVMPLMRWIDPELAHRISIAALASGFVGGAPAADDVRLETTLFGRRLSNPIGLAAGFDKNAVAIDGLAQLGFGFLETGTVTPRPQEGNSRPRLFRLVEDRAVVNRMGFNNAGLNAYVGKLRAKPAGILPVGANVGINKDGSDPLRDYPLLVKAVAPHADYVVINVSSPNTPGLRDLQAEDRLRAILQGIAVAIPGRPPLLVKLAPDLSVDAVERLVEACVAEGVDGLIISNTTISRPTNLKSRNAVQTGGLSGAPLFGPSTDMLRRVARLAGDRLVLIGVGGVFSGEDILAKLRAGASAVQIYTSFAYDGPMLLPRLKGELLQALDRHGFANVTAAIGADLRSN